VNIVNCVQMTDDMLSWRPEMWYI